MGLFQQKAVQIRDGEGLPAAEEPCLSCLLPAGTLLSQAATCHASVSDCRLQQPVEEVVDSSLGTKVPLLVSLLHPDTPVLSPCGHMPFLLPFLSRFLPTPSHSCTITPASYNSRKPAIDLSCPKPLPHLLLPFQVTVPALKHSLPML